VNFSGYRFLWLQVLFDLPVKKKKDRKAATDFRNFLLDLGFEMAQFSVYQRFCSGKDKAETFIRKIESNLPKSGRVHILTFTDKQYENMRTFRGKNEDKNCKNTDQLLLF
jgi:CRISPR-associated protein Cas2